MNIGAQIAKLRKQQGMTQKELAAVIGVIDQAVSKWESELYYLNMANLVDKLKDAGLSRSADIYKPMRDSVGHTSILTDIAKNHLTVEYENIKARLIELLKEIDTSKGEK